MTPVRSSPKRLGEFDAVPLEQYDQTVWGNVAAVYPTMTDFDGPLRMLLKKRVCPTFYTHGVFNWAVRLMIPTVGREPRAVTPGPPSEGARRTPAVGMGRMSIGFLIGL